ncbi:hypothetical protein GUY44_07070 [Pimelobacter simplex]|uniref:Uncharacterized protein n=1 Tax=Nocardioides simplex TaxID=2045 RepID=A0A0A1DMH5_NOCSI|nr:hypothetical protein [Pimelobacter simplex]AIY17768.1 hypothetical protein KR76_15165 [Pimelobacter simplex]MCG8150233.1 hypothetical protein [Pimelobacter simplex]GEB13557.1 hypothetical protein NSI01_18720 [Pimelobacter simplex]SFM71741.1 hypothetical protein SAMN05421671_3114 [Pimelobacter simplex]
MTLTPSCHYDRTLRYRVAHGPRGATPHLPDCASDHTCPGHRGCAPCEERHCALCGREHATTAQPQTCPECQGKVDNDLADTQAGYAALSAEALEAGHDGKLVAAAPIPGGDAQVLIGPTVRLDAVLVSRTYRDDHRRADAVPPLAVLAHWEDVYRTFLDQAGTSRPPKTARWGQKIAGYRRPTISSAIAYLRDHLPDIAQRTDGPDFLAFTREIRSLRAQIERALHDEREPERGVECFECGDELVRRFRDPKRCRHRTPARRRLQAALVRRAAAQDWLRVLASYPELGGPRVDEVKAAAALPASLVAEARTPCGACSRAWKESQGGLDDPGAGRSWECPGCRKEYSVAEYATAVRSSLVGGTDETGWCTLQAAADAAAEITGRPISAPTIRVWIARGDDIGIACRWVEGARGGVQVVSWPDVLRRAVERRSGQRGGRIGA